MKKLFLIIAFLVFYTPIFSQEKIVIFASIDDFDEDLNNDFQRALKSYFTKANFKKKFTFENYTKSVKELKNDSTCISLLKTDFEPEYFIYISPLEQKEVEVKEKPLIFQSSIDLARRAINNNKAQTVLRRKYKVVLENKEGQIIDEYGLVFDRKDFREPLYDYKKHLQKKLLK